MFIFLLGTQSHAQIYPYYNLLSLYNVMHIMYTQEVFLIKKVFKLY